MSFRIPIDRMGAARAPTTRAATSRPGTLGTFAGVFTPSILTILGIILFLRLGYVVGGGGLVGALAVIALAALISVLTSLSLAAIATNMRVKGGGDYYIISRTLGVEFGGALGAVLFLAQAVSIAFYAIGFAEALSTIIPGIASSALNLVAAGAVLALFGLAWIGADVATKFQFFVMAALVAALGSFFVGALSGLDASRLAHSGRPASPIGFWVLFAVFFPAVTGFTQGVSMSGDLRDPVRSIPRGTFMAVGLSTVVYVVVAVLLAATVPLAALATDYGALRRVAAVPWLIDAGVIAATLSSAMASFLGAPRILQALARDRTFGFLDPFAAGAGPSENPRRAVLLALLIALITIAAGDLNLVAAVVSMFFLVSYGLINYATYYEAWANSPSFRPRFRFFNRYFCLTGAVLCLGAMLAISPWAAAAAGAVITAIYQYLRRTAGPSRWADASRAFHFQRIRESLAAMSEDPPHDRDWRPVVLAFSDNPARREPLMTFARWIDGGAGLTAAVSIVVGSGAVARRSREEAEAALRDNLKELGSSAYPLVVSGPELYAAAQVLIQSHGLGSISANTILLNWIEQLPDGRSEAEERQYGAYLRMALRLGRNVIVLDADDRQWARLDQTPARERRIDVWWYGDATSRLMLLLAYLMTRSDPWKDARIAVRAAVGPQQHADVVTAEVTKFLRGVRIDADAEAVPRPDADAIVRLSQDASLVFLPMLLRGDHPRGPADGPVEALISRLPVTALTIAARDIELTAEPDEGEVAQAAAARDAAAEAEQKAQAAQQEAEKAARQAKDAAARLATAQSIEEGAGDEGLEQIRVDAQRAAELAEEARRRAFKARAKADAAAAEAAAPSSSEPAAPTEPSV